MAKNGKRSQGKTMNDKRLIEETIPLEDISRESAREKSIRHGHISTLHIWWARRPLVASRAAVFGSLVIPAKISQQTLKRTAKVTKDGLMRLKNEIVDDETLKGKELYHFMRILCTWEASNDEEIINHARELIKESHDGKTPKVLDPFAGGGSIPLEALRLGCETYANELNPVAHIIELCTLVYPQKYGKWVEIEVEDENKAQGQLKMETGKKTKKVNQLAEDVRKWGNWVLDEAKKEIEEFYPPNPDGSIPVGYIWARTIPCANPTCKTDIPLLRRLWLSKKKGKEVALKIRVNSKNKEVKFEIAKGKEVEEYDPSKGTTARAHVYCPSCNSTMDDKTLRKMSKSGRMGERLIVVVEIRSDKTGKNYRIATERDLNIFRQADDRLQKKIEKWKWKTKPLSDEEITGWGRDFKVPLYGMSKWTDLFNKRQMLAILIFLDKVLEAKKNLEKTSDSTYGKAIVTYLSVILDKTVIYSTNLGYWHNTRELVNPGMGRQALVMVWDYAETNVINGNGSWPNNLDWVLNVIENISSINNISTLELGSATKMPFKNRFFDYVVTDPPYYDNIIYSDLSDFFYIWLKQTLGDLYPEVFKTPLTPKKQEIVQNPARHNGNNIAAKKFFVRIAYRYI